MSRSMVKFMHVDGFYDNSSIDFYINAVSGLPFAQKEYGEEIENFRTIIPGMEPLFSKVIGERVKIDNERSGVFRKPMRNIIHFENFDSTEEWCFIAALEKNEFNIYHHISEHDKGEFSKVDSPNVLHGYNFNYRNLFEWKIHTNVILQPNDGVFIRPWMFHSLDDGLVQYFRLIADKMFRILVMGKDATTRRVVSKKLAEIIPNSELLISSDLRIKEMDVDYSYDGQMRHTFRVLEYARNSKYETVIIDMTCPLEEMRETLCSDIIIWVDDINNINMEERQSPFIRPKLYDIKVNKVDGNDAIYEEIVEKIKSKRF
jgi:hypothetical protein